MTDQLVFLQLMARMMDYYGVTCSFAHGAKEDPAFWEQLMDGRSIYQRSRGDAAFPVCQGNDHLIAATAAPILCQGDVLGLVLFAAGEGQYPGESEYKLAQTVSSFLGKHMES